MDSKQLVNDAWVLCWRLQDIILGFTNSTQPERRQKVARIHRMAYARYLRRLNAQNR
jgi:hypothetical protein